MNFRPQFSLMALLCVAFSARGMERKSLMAPARLGALKVLHEKNQFSLDMDGDIKPIQRCFVDKTVRDLNSEQLKSFVVNGGYLKLRELRSKDGVEYGLDADGRLNGGGPISGVLTFIGGSLATATAAAAIVITAPLHPVTATIAVVATVKGGMAATTYAAIAVTALPIP